MKYAFIRLKNMLSIPIPKSLATRDSAPRVRTPSYKKKNTSSEYTPLCKKETGARHFANLRLPLGTGSPIAAALVRPITGPMRHPRQLAPAQHANSFPFIFLDTERARVHLFFREMTECAIILRARLNFHRKWGLSARARTFYFEGACTFFFLRGIRFAGFRRLVLRTAGCVNHRNGVHGCTCIFGLFIGWVMEQVTGWDYQLYCINILYLARR